MSIEDYKYMPRKELIDKVVSQEIKIKRLEKELSQAMKRIAGMSSAVQNGARLQQNGVPQPRVTQPVQQRPAYPYPQQPPYRPAPYYPAQGYYSSQPPYYPAAQPEYNANPAYYPPSPRPVPAPQPMPQPAPAPAQPRKPKAEDLFEDYEEDYSDDVIFFDGDDAIAEQENYPANADETAEEDDFFDVDEFLKDI